MLIILSVYKNTEVIWWWGWRGWIWGKTIIGKMRSSFLPCFKPWNTWLIQLNNVSNHDHNNQHSFKEYTIIKCRHAQHINLTLGVTFGRISNLYTGFYLQKLQKVVLFIHFIILCTMQCRSFVTCNNMLYIQYCCIYPIRH